MGYKFQFVTLAGFHAMNHSMFTLSKDYAARGSELHVACVMYVVWLHLHSSALSPWNVIVTRAVLQAVVSKELAPTVHLRPM